MIPIPGERCDKYCEDLSRALSQLTRHKSCFRDDRGLVTEDVIREQVEKLIPKHNKTTFILSSFETIIEDIRKRSKRWQKQI